MQCQVVIAVAFLDARRKPPVASHAARSIGCKISINLRIHFVDQTFDVGHVSIAHSLHEFAAELPHVFAEHVTRHFCFARCR